MLNAINSLRDKVTLGMKIALALLLCVSILGEPVSAAASDAEWNTAYNLIDQSYDTMLHLESTIKSEKLSIQTLRKTNNEKLATLNTKIKQIDRSKIDKLQKQVDELQKKYAPLLAEYTELGKKAAEARKRKDQKSATLYELKRNRLKPTVTTAKQEIKSSKEALASAKKNAAAKSKLVKDQLIPVRTLKAKITAENKKITAWNKEKAAMSKQYKAAIKEGDAIIAAAKLYEMVQTLSNIHSSLKEIRAWEQTIAKTLTKAETKLP